MWSFFTSIFEKIKVDIIIFVDLINNLEKYLNYGVGIVVNFKSKLHIKFKKSKIVSVGKMIIFYSSGQNFNSYLVSPLF